MSVLISCEVGGDIVPPQLPTLRVAAPAHSSETGSRSKAPRQNQDHSVIDPAIAPDVTAMYVAKRMAACLRAPLITNGYSRELIDVRRSLHHRQLFSKTTRDWSDSDRQQLIEKIYRPYRDGLRTKLGRMLSREQYVIHVSVQSFPLSSGKTIRRADMGLLYDPSVQDEVDICLDWIDEMYDEIEMLRVRRNYPQRGTRDSITRAMRSEFAGQNYLGIELMVNQAWAGREIAIRDEVIDGICWTLETILETPQSKAA